MTHRQTTHAHDSPTVGPSAQGYRSIVVPLDLSPLSDRVLGRVALVPIANHAHITLLHVVAGDQPARARRRAADDATRALDAERAALLPLLPPAVHVLTHVRDGTADREISRCAQETDAELVVMGRGGANAVRDYFLGSTAERVIRMGRVPVLAVRNRPLSPYRHPTLALDLEPVPDEVLSLLLRLIPPPRPMVTIVHAFDVPLPGLLYPALTADEAEEMREHYRGVALAELDGRLAALLADSMATLGAVPTWRIEAAHGSARGVIAHAVRRQRTDLLALATRARQGLVGAWLGTVAGDMLRAATCDVLVVPPARAHNRAEPSRTPPYGSDPAA